MKKVSKIMTFLLIVMVLLTVTTNVLAATADTGYTPNSFDGKSSADVSGIANLGNSVVKILSTIGIVVSVIILIVLGIKYMLGSAEEKAEYKKTLLPYIIGAALIFAASTIANMVYNFMQNI